MQEELVVIIKDKVLKRIRTKWVGICLFINDYIDNASPDYAGFISLDPIKWEIELHTFKAFNRAGRGICSHYKK